MHILCNNIPIGSMYGIFTYMWLKCMVNVGKYSIHGSYGIYITRIVVIYILVGIHKSLELSVMVFFWLISGPLIQATTGLGPSNGRTLRAFISSNVISRILSSWIDETRWGKERKKKCSG